MSSNTGIENLLDSHTPEEIVDFFKSNALLSLGTAEITKASIIGQSIVKGIVAELPKLLPIINSEIKYNEPCRKSITLIERGSDKYTEALSSLSMILNYDDIYRAITLLKTRGICLSGKAGIGKGLLANNIGAEIVRSNEHYDSYANLVVSCSSSINPNNVTWGTGMNNVEVLGAVYTASKYASEHPNTAVVLIFDELFDCDWKSVLGKALELFSDKTRGTYSVMSNGETIKYENNLFVIATGNAGEGYGHASVDDERFKTRFVDVQLTGVFQSKRTLEKYSEYICNLLGDEDKAGEYYNVLLDIFTLIEDIGDEKVCRTISLRALNNLVVTASTVDEFTTGVHRLFTQSDRKGLGWE